jgi:transposase-like protein
MVILSLQCPKCDGSENIRKNGHSTSGHQRYQYTDYRYTFQTDYSMKSSDPRCLVPAFSGLGFS